MSKKQAAINMLTKVKDFFDKAGHHWNSDEPYKKKISKVESINIQVNVREDTQWLHKCPEIYEGWGVGLVIGICPACGASQGTEESTMGLIKAGEYTYVLHAEQQITLRPEVQWFAEQMELALRDNENKTAWKDCSQDWLLEQMYRNASKITKTNTILRKPVNVANYAMMIADNARYQENGGMP